MDIDVKAIKKRFLVINRERLQRIQHGLSWRQRDFLDLIPVFFHLNHAMLPGFVSKETPAGISKYVPSQKSLDAVKAIAKTFVHKQRALRGYDIFSLFIMGSMGTIAQSADSDFDIWVCHNPDLNKRQLGELRQKCDRIEEWGAGIGLEVHFFLVNSDEFRQGEMEELSSESSGSTQHHLLLEEFYRTSILVAGRYPIWWLVPPEEEVNYDDFTYQLTHKRFVSSDEVIDFGGLDRIPVEEFFGAALWQVYKGIDSPYKSVLKILLMETYASEFPKTELISMQYKRCVYDGVCDLNLLDPYAMLLHRLESHLEKSDDKIRLQLVRRCFYFKVNQPLSTVVRKDDDWQRELLWNMIEQWGWQAAELKELDNRDSWKVESVFRERKLLVDELTKSYLFLSNFARNCADLPSISQTDLNILGRKLYAAFERKAGKIELINRGISSNIHESKITVQQIANLETKEEVWSLLAEKNDNGNPVQAVLKKGRSAAELITWCHFNKIIHAGTVISLNAIRGILTVKEIRSILDALDHEYPGGAFFVPQSEDFNKPPVIAGGSLFVNVGLDPLPQHSRRGTDIVSDRSDILNYSGFSFNLALSFDMVIISSWHEILTYRYSGVQGLLNCICQYLWWHKKKDFQHGPATLSAFSFSSTHSIAIAQRIEKLFSDFVRNFYFKGELRQLNYILEIEQSYYVISTDIDNFQYEHAESLSGLCEILARPQQSFVPIMADRYALCSSVLPQLFSKNKSGKIQLFYEVSASIAIIYVLDDHGSLFNQFLPFHDDQALVSQFSLFFKSVLSRRGYLMEQNSASNPADSIECYRVTKRVSGAVVFDRSLMEDIVQRARYFHVQVIGNVVNQKTVFTIYCDDMEFSSYEYGSGLFKEVAKFVLSQRKSGIKYPIYITDLDLAPGLLDDRPSSSVQIIEFLNYKKRIEEKLNSELSKL
ncbi:MAG: class I adenylate cyclase [Thiohalomonadales bacterium]